MYNIKKRNGPDYIRVFSEHKNNEQNEKLNQLGQKIVNDMLIG